MDVIAERIAHPGGPPNAFSIITLWREGHDTYEIAKLLSVGSGEISEAYIANRLAKLREVARRG